MFVTLGLAFVIVFVFLWGIISRIFHDFFVCIPHNKLSVKLSQSARGHFVTLIQKQLASNMLKSCRPDISEETTWHIQYIKLCIQR